MKNDSKPRAKTQAEKKREAVQAVADAYRAEEAAHAAYLAARRAHVEARAKLAQVTRELIAVSA